MDDQVGVSIEHQYGADKAEPQQAMENGAGLKNHKLTWPWQSLLQSRLVNFWFYSPTLMENVSHEEALENLQANYATDRNQFQRILLQRGGGREIRFPFDPDHVQNDLQRLQMCSLLRSIE